MLFLPIPKMCKNILPKSFGALLEIASFSILGQNLEIKKIVSRKLK